MLPTFVLSVQNYPNPDHKYERYNSFQHLILSSSVNHLVRSNYNYVHRVRM
jgi:hypothetical protein